jgi:hypothetical protein
MSRPALTGQASTSAYLAGYSTPVAMLAALLLLAYLTARLAAVPLALAALLADRTACRLDEWLAALPQPRPPVQARRRGVNATSAWLASHIRAQQEADTRMTTRPLALKCQARRQ